MGINIPSKRETSIHQSWGNSPLRYFLISIFWLPVALFWGMMLPLILPDRVVDFAGEAHKGAFLGIVGVIGAAAAALIQLIIGPISDNLKLKFGRRRPFILVGTTIACVGMIWFGYAQSFAALTASYFLIQLFLNLAVGPYIAYMPDLVPTSKQGAASAIMGVMQLAGKAGGPLIAGLVAAAVAKPYAKFSTLTASQSAALTLSRDHAFQHLLLIDVALFAVCTVITLFTLPDPPADNETTLKEAIGSLFVWNRKANINFFRLLLSRGVYNFGFYLALGYLNYYVRDSLKLGEAGAGILTLMQVATIGGALLGTFPAGIMADRGSKKSVVYVSCAFSGIAMVAFAFAQTPTIAVIMAVAFGIGYGAFCAVDWAFACNLLPDGSPAKFMAIWSLSDTIPQVLSPAFGPIADFFNHSIGIGAGWRAAMLLAAVSIVGGAIVIRMVEERKNPEFTPENVFHEPSIVMPEPSDITEQAL